MWSHCILIPINFIPWHATMVDYHPVVNGGSDLDLWVFMCRIESGAIRSYQEFPNRILVWLVVWNMTFIFPFSWECHHPNWRTLIFFRGVETQPPTSFKCLSWVMINHPAQDTRHHLMGEHATGSSTTTRLGAGAVPSPVIPRWRGFPHGGRK